MSGYLIRLGIPHKQDLFRRAGEMAQDLEQGLGVGLGPFYIQGRDHQIELRGQAVRAEDFPDGIWSGWLAIARFISRGKVFNSSRR